MSLIDPIKTELLEAMGISESDIEAISKIPPPWNSDLKSAMKHEIAKLTSPTTIEYQTINLPLYRFSDGHGQIKIWAALHEKTLFLAMAF